MATGEALHYDGPIRSIDDFRLCSSERRGRIMATLQNCIAVYSDDAGDGLAKNSAECLRMMISEYTKMAQVIAHEAVDALDAFHSRRRTKTASPTSEITRLSTKE